MFRVTRPAELWHMNMTSTWVAERGWVYLNAIIDCCTREIVGWEVSLRCRAKEAWFSKLKERLIWRTEFETLEQLRVELAGYIDRYRPRPHSGLDYRTPKEVRQTWDDAQEQSLKLAA